MLICVGGKRERRFMSRDNITIRTATPDDEKILSDLLAAAYGELAQASYDSETLAAALPLMSRANPKLLASGSYYIAEIEGAAAGCGGWTMDKPGSGEIAEGVGHIRHFATHPAHLRKGVARLLLEHCLAEARAAGIRVMMSQSTLPAEQFYAAAGFRRIGPIEVEMGPGVVLPAVEMQRQLS
jgi:N-acetylglutamate synthase-like GNAT family acetyltransferase